jgi:hypothetical protein
MYWLPCGGLGHGSRWGGGFTDPAHHRGERGPDSVYRLNTLLQAKNACLIGGIGRYQILDGFLAELVENEIQRVVTEKPFGFPRVVFFHQIDARSMLSSIYGIGRYHSARVADSLAGWSDQRVIR